MSWLSWFRVSLPLLYGFYNVEKGRMRREPFTSAIGLVLVVLVLLAVYVGARHTITIHVRYTPTTTTTSTTGVVS